VIRKGQKTTWRLLLAALLALVAVGGLFTAGPAAAAPTGEGIDIGNMSNTSEPAEGISPDGARVCAVWTTFDLDPNKVYVRIYNTATGTLSPSYPYELSEATNTGKAHCAIDGAGNTHVVWQQCSSGECQTAYRMLPAGADPGSGWTNLYSVEFNRDGPDIDALYADTNGQVWLAYRQYPGAFQVRSWKNGSWSGPQTISADTNAEKVRIRVDDAGYVNLTWRDGNNGVGYAYRNPSTGQFSGKYVIPGSNGAGIASLAVDRGTGDVHIAYSKNFTELHYVKGGRGGANFLDRTIAQASGQTLSPRIAWSKTGRIIIAFDNGNKVSIDAIVSEDRGASWGGVFTVAKPGGGAEAPWVVADNNGGAYILYAHRSGSAVYLTTIGGTGVGATPSPSPSPGPSLSPSPSPAPPVTTFGDVPTTYWAYTQIEQFAARGITTGCDTGRYCPERGVTRAEMAVFLDRTLGQGELKDGRQTFADVPPTYWAYGWIERFYTLGVTTGCGANAAGQRIYCPDRGVTRAEMAAFLERAKGDLTPPTPAAQRFADVPPSHPQYAFIEALYNRGVTTGCGANAQGQLIYCPERGVNRAEIAVFIIRAFPR
jgi:hypothetical protein